MILTEIDDEGAARLLETEQDLLFRCDSILYLYEAGDRDQIEFIKEMQANIQHLRENN